MTFQNAYEKFMEFLGEINANTFIHSPIFWIAGAVLLFIIMVSIVSKAKW